MQDNAIGRRLKGPDKGAVERFFDELVEIADVLAFVMMASEPMAFF